MKNTKAFILPNGIKMIKITFECETVEEANVYVNAIQTRNLLSDFVLSMHNAKKHGTDAEVLRNLTAFYDDLVRAADHASGPY